MQSDSLASSLKTAARGTVSILIHHLEFDLSTSSMSVWLGFAVDLLERLMSLLRQELFLKHSIVDSFEFSHHHAVLSDLSLIHI